METSGEACVYLVLPDGALDGFEYTDETIWFDLTGSEAQKIAAAKAGRSRPPRGTQTRGATRIPSITWSAASRTARKSSAFSARSSSWACSWGTMCPCWPPR